MEENLRFVECYSKYVFRPGILPPKLQEAWELLCSIVDHYIRPGDCILPPAGDAASSSTAAAQPRSVPKGTVESAQHGAALVFKFAKLLESINFPHKLFTYNLHMLACRLVWCPLTSLAWLSFVPVPIPAMVPHYDCSCQSHR